MEKMVSLMTKRGEEAFVLLMPQTAELGVAFDALNEFMQVIQQGIAKHAEQMKEAAAKSPVVDEVGDAQ